MNIDQLLDTLKADESFMSCVTHWQTIPPRAAVYAPFSSHISEKVISAYAKKGIAKLYRHQKTAIDLIHEGKDVVVVTPTASGKTLCYNIPVLDEIIKNPSARALYLFPTKSLSADQVSELYEIINLAEIDVKTYTYDGDTPANARKAVRQAGNIVVTNPDMLHTGILPHHTKWIKLFENIKFIVIDEIHTYRGVFGSHMANVIRRLRRIMEFYGSNPQFICCSATVNNPAELASNIIGREVYLVDDNGAPSGRKNLIFYNPPVVNRQLGIRKSSLLETRSIASNFVKNDISTIVFGKSRLAVEVLVNYLKENVKDILGNADAVKGYRGGYLPTQRRSIERGLRSGEIRCVVSTNALELGIDIGSLQACVLCGYPGTISGTWQESGRAGRRNETSATIMVASSAPLDQFIINHPEYFLGMPPESALVAKDNLYILISHLKCASYELPFKDGEKYGSSDITEILDYLQQLGVLRHVGDTWHWMSDEFPANEISLRSASNENFIIVDITRADSHRVIGEMDRFTAPMLLHDEAIYLHEANQYQVEKLDFEQKKAFVRSVNVDYYTDADLAVSLKVLDPFDEAAGAVGKGWGDVMIASRVNMFKKIKFDTHENLGWGKVRLPELEMHTTAVWFALSDEISSKFEKEQLQDAMTGVASLLSAVAPVYLMCDPRDIAVVYQAKSTYTEKPTIFIYDNMPGGVGFSEKLFNIDKPLFSDCLQLLKSCRCLDGCPSCVGADCSDKRMARKLLEVLTDA